MISPEQPVEEGGRGGWGESLFLLGLSWPSPAWFFSWRTTPKGVCIPQKTIMSKHTGTMWCQSGPICLPIGTNGGLLLLPWLWEEGLHRGSTMLAIAGLTQGICHIPSLKIFLVPHLTFQSSPPDKIQILCSLHRHSFGNTVISASGSSVYSKTLFLLSTSQLSNQPVSCHFIGGNHQLQGSWICDIFKKSPSRFQGPEDTLF